MNHLLDVSFLLACGWSSHARYNAAGTFRFRDPLNKERHFIPLCLEDGPIKGSLAQFL